MKLLIFIILLLSSAICSAQQISPGKYFLVGVRNFDVKAVAPKICDQVLELEISAGNFVTLRNKLWGACEKPSIDPSPKTIKISPFDMDEKCEQIFIDSPWNPFMSNLWVYDFRTVPSSCSPLQKIALQLKSNRFPDLNPMYATWE